MSECESARRSDDDDGTGSRAASPAEPSFAGLSSLSSCQNTGIGEHSSIVTCFVNNNCDEKSSGLDYRDRPSYSTWYLV